MVVVSANSPSRITRPTLAAIQRYRTIAAAQLCQKRLSSPPCFTRGHSSRDTPVAINELLVRTLGRQAKPNASPDGLAHGAPAAPASRRELRFAGRWWPECPVFARAGLGPGWTASGPAIIEQDLATLLVPPGFRAETGALGDIMLTRES